jgi:hypothetical protein
MKGFDAVIARDDAVRGKNDFGVHHSSVPR